jgi:hypothetical protein
MSSKQSSGETKTDKSCGICCEDFDNSSRKIVTCEFCDLSACRECVKYYLTSKTDMANCMGCNKPWDRKFMQDALTKSYFNKGWKNHQCHLSTQHQDQNQTDIFRRQYDHIIIISIR